MHFCGIKWPLDLLKVDPLLHQGHMFSLVPAVLMTILAQTFSVELQFLFYFWLLPVVLSQVF